MTVREGIIDFLRRQSGFIPSGKLHRYLTRSGYHRASCGSALARMVARGEVLTLGKNKDTSIKLNPEYTATEPSVRQIANHAHLSKPVLRPVAQEEESEPSIFDECRQHSNIYALIDQPLREVRP